jgi:hypothetical protein
VDGRRRSTAGQWRAEIMNYFRRIGVRTGSKATIIAACIVAGCARGGFDEQALSNMVNDAEQIAVRGQLIGDDWITTSSSSGSSVVVAIQDVSPGSGQLTFRYDGGVLHLDSIEVKGRNTSVGQALYLDGFFGKRLSSSQIRNLLSRRHRTRITRYQDKIVMLVSGMEKQTGDHITLEETEGSSDIKIMLGR